MDNGYKFEELINNYIGTPVYVTYATYWNNKKKRTALLFTACIKEYDENSSGEIGQKLEFFMQELFNDDKDRKISIECLKFLRELNKYTN